MGGKRINPAGLAWVPKWRRRRLRHTPHNPPRPRVGGTLLSINLPVDVFDRISEIAKRRTLSRAEVCRRCISIVLDEGDLAVEAIAGPFRQIDITFPDDHYEIIKALAKGKGMGEVARCFIAKGIQRYEISHLLRREAVQEPSA